MSARERYLDDDTPTLVRVGFGAVCRWCGRGHEGTGGHAIEHFRECTGVAAYGRAHAMGVDIPTAIRLATWVYRDHPRGDDKAFRWDIRDYATRYGLIAADDGPLR